MDAYTHTRIDYLAGRSVLETAVIALGITVLWFVTALVAFAAASTVSGDPLLAVVVAATTGLATITAGVLGAKRFNRSLDGRFDRVRRSETRGVSDGYDTLDAPDPDADAKREQNSV